MYREKSAKMAIWQKNSHFAILALFSLCINFKNSFCQMTSYWLLWKTYYSLLLKNYLWPCPGPSMYLSERMNWIISSFPFRISKILFVLDSWGDFGRLEIRIGTGAFFWCSTFYNNAVKGNPCCTVWARRRRRSVALQSTAAKIGSGPFLRSDMMMGFDRNTRCLCLSKLKADSVLFELNPVPFSHIFHSFQGLQSKSQRE